MFYLFNPYTVTVGNETLTLTNNDLLNAQTLTNAIGRGEGRVGRLCFGISGDRRLQIASHQFKIVLECRDFEQTVYQAVYIPSAVPLDGLKLYPGEQVQQKTPQIATSSLPSLPNGEK